MGALPALNFLFDPPGVRFGAPHYLVLLQHWASCAGSGSPEGLQALLGNVPPVCVMRPAASPKGPVGFGAS